MACDVKIQITSWQDKKDEYGRINRTKDTNNTNIFSGLSEDQELTLDMVADYIMQLPKSKRANLASLLRDAVQTQITEKNYEMRFVSNITPSDLLTKYPDLQKEYEDLDVDLNDNYTLVFAKSLKINNNDYFGKWIDPDGNPIFFIRNKFGAIRFLNYLKAKQAIKKNLDTIKLTDQEVAELEAIKARYKQNDISKLLLTYLDSAKEFKSFKNKDGKIISTAKFLDTYISRLIGTNGSNKSGVYMALYNEAAVDNKGYNKFNWKFNSTNLFKVLKVYYEDALKEIGVESVEDFKKLSNEKISQLINELFSTDVKLMQAKVQKITGGEEKEKENASQEKNITQGIIKATWQNIKKDFNAKKGKKDKGLESFEKALEAKPTDVVKKLQQYFDQNGVDINDEHYTGIKVSIKDGKIIATYTTKPTTSISIGNKDIYITFPWTRLGDFHGYAQDTKSIWRPVSMDEDPDLEANGMYHGVYLYEYYNPKAAATEYAISRHVISPNSTSHLYTSLQDAKNKIDQWNREQKISQYGLHKMKMTDDPRKVMLDFVGIRQGQIITSLNASLPKIDKLPDFLYNLINGTLPQFYNYFSDVDGITKLNTPEKAAIFIYKLYDEIKRLHKTSKDGEGDFTQLMEDNPEIAKNIIAGIELLKPVNYLVETFSTNKNLATLRRLPNNGNEIDLTVDFESKDVSTIGDLQKAADFFKKKYKLEIDVYSKEELEEFKKNHPSITIDPAARAFVYEGHIYINGAKANLSDMFHEMSHIFLGIIKATNRSAYENLVQHYKESNQKEFDKVFSSVQKNYKGFSREDLMEETMVTLISRHMYGKKSLIRGFNGTDFDDDFNFILNDVYHNYKEIINSNKENSLDFQGFITQLMNKKNMKVMDKNMKLSNFIKQMISVHKIDEINC